MRKPTPEEQKETERMLAEADEQAGPLSPEDQAYYDLMIEVEALGNNMKNTRDFIKFLTLLENGYESGVLPQQPVDAYIAGLITAVELIDENIEDDEEDPVGPVDWEWLSHIMFRAFEE